MAECLREVLWAAGVAECLLEFLQPAEVPCLDLCKDTFDTLYSYLVLFTTTLIAIVVAAYTAAFASIITRTHGARRSSQESDSMIRLRLPILCRSFRAVSLTVFLLALLR